MKIAVTTYIEDLPMIQQKLNTLGDVIYDTNLSNGEADIIFCNPNNQMFKWDESKLAGTNVKIICTASTGTNHIDLDYCKANNIKVISLTSQRRVLDKIPSTAEHAFTLMMSALRHIPAATDSVKLGSWDWTPYVGKQLSDCNVGIVGFGRLGTMMYKYCDAFGANIKIYDPYVKDSLSDHFLLNHWSSKLEKLFSWADVISLHVHVTEETYYMINDSILKHANGLILVNTSRGEIVNEMSIQDALYKKRLSYYATDVIEHEFLDNWQSISPIEPSDNVIVTPHIGGMTEGARNTAYNAAVELLKGELNE